MLFPSERGREDGAWRTGPSLCGPSKNDSGKRKVARHSASALLRPGIAFKQLRCRALNC